jgi:hypothetical protein
MIFDDKEKREAMEKRLNLAGFGTIFPKYVMERGQENIIRDPDTDLFYFCESVDIFSAYKVISKTDFLNERDNLLKEGWTWS